MADQEPPFKKKRVSFAPDTTFASSDEGTDSEPENPLVPTDAEEHETSLYTLPNIPPPGVVAAAQYSASGPNSALPSRNGSISTTTTITTTTATITTTATDESPREHPPGVEVEVPSSPPQSSDQTTPVLSSPPPPQGYGNFFPPEMLVSSPDAAAVKLPSSPELQSVGSKKRRHDEIDYVSDSSESSSSSKSSSSSSSSSEKLDKEKKVVKMTALSSGLSLGTPQRSILKKPTRSPLEESTSTAEGGEALGLIEERLGSSVGSGRRKAHDEDMEDADSEAKDADAEEGRTGRQRVGSGGVSEGGDTGSDYQGQSDSESEEE